MRAESKKHRKAAEARNAVNCFKRPRVNTVRLKLEKTRARTRSAFLTAHAHACLCKPARRGDRNGRLLARRAVPLRAPCRARPARPPVYVGAVTRRARKMRPLRPPRPRFAGPRGGALAATAQFGPLHSAAQASIPHRLEGRGHAPRFLPFLLRKSPRPLIRARRWPAAALCARDTAPPPPRTRTVVYAVQAAAITAVPAAAPQQNLFY